MSRIELVRTLVAEADVRRNPEIVTMFENSGLEVLAFFFPGALGCMVKSVTHEDLVGAAAAFIRQRTFSRAPLRERP